MAKKKSYEATRNALLTKALANPMNEDSMHSVAVELEENPKYSLDPDPTGELGMTPQEKNFTRWYVQHRNIAVASQLAEISVEDGMSIYRSFACQAELRRIDMAWKLRQLNTSTMNLEQIGSVLTSYVLDQSPEADKLSTKDKMAAMKMIMDIHALKQKVIEEATPIDAVDIEAQIKDMSADALKSLIEQTKTLDTETDEKEDLIKKIDDESMLSNDDLHYLRSLSVNDLKQLIDDQTEIKNEIAEENAKKPAKQKTLTPLDETDVIDGDDITGA